MSSFGPYAYILGAALIVAAVGLIVSRKKKA